MRHPSCSDTPGSEPRARAVTGCSREWLDGACASCDAGAWRGGAARLAAYGVALHAAGVGGGVEDAVTAGHRADPAQGPGRADVDQVAAAAEFGDHRFADPRLDVQGPGLGLARVERRRHVRGVERREVDRLLQVHAERQVVEEEQQRPLILLVAAWRAEREVRLT